MKILVTGGAGYIGSSCVKALLAKGHDVIVADNLSKGMKKLVDKKAKFYKIDLCDEKLSSLLKNIEAVVHIAAYKAVGESMKNPEKYSDNIKGTINLLNAMKKHGVKRIIYSGSAAVFGKPAYSPLDEKHPCAPINYYGFTKLCSEQLIKWYAELYGFTFASLRYFNVAGDYGLGYLDPEPQNVMPILMEVATGKRDKFVIFGNDYKTRDGTCVRDYIDVRDLVRAHVLALDLKQNAIINLGTAKGTSVKELVAAVKKITKKDFKVEIGARREGDPAELVASNALAKKLLNWKPEHNIQDMVESTYKAYI
ncbi:UDP-glucose 4-epimerase GalE [Candidatus Woesearchaeota archaeon]|nr:UDP-glucose 4-epimerase GalE [Candidatus Woesearchaeota archaeon]